MNLKKLSDEVLLSETKRLAKEERELLTLILYHLKEVERRRLFSALKYQSIHEYAMKELGYSQDQAGRRVAAARLLSEIPSIEEKINSGSLNLTTLGLAQALFQREKKQHKKPLSQEQKMSVLEKIENKTTREADCIVWSFSSTPRPKVRETVKMISEDEFECNFAANRETQQKIERLKGLLAHSNPGMTLGELVDKLCDLGLDQWDPARKTVRQKRSTESKVALPRLNFPKSSQKESLQRDVSRVDLSRAEISRIVWRKAQSQCTNCGSYYAPEEDHRRPRAKGGATTPENMRLLCRSCNQRAAIEEFGPSKMEAYLS